MDKSNKYGFFATFSIIFAGVVGVGIFFKGETVMSLTQSGLLMVVAWLFISIIVLGLAYSYIEISSSTIKGKDAEQGSLYNWSSKFWNKRFGSFVGIFYCFFYMPLNLLALGLISSRMFINLFVGQDYGILQLSENNQSWATSNERAQILYGMMVFIMAMMLIFFFISVNAFGTKFSKHFQGFGTILKVVLLIAVIFIIFIALFSGINSDPPIVDGNDYDNTFVGDPKIGGFFLALPAVMFSLDGFVMSGTLQSDTKERKTFSRALITAMSTIIILYLFVITGSALIRDSGVYDIPGIINRIFGDLPVFQITLLFLIALSGISATNSWFIYLGRTVYDLADHEEIVNKNGDLNYKHEVTGAYTYSYRLILSLLVTYLVIFFVLDMALFPYGNNVDVRDYFGNVEIASTDLIVMMMFMVYGLIVLGGIRNHKSKKVEVDRVKGFTPISIGVIALLFSVVSLYVVSIFIGYFGPGSNINRLNSNFGSFWALPIDIVIISLIFIVWAIMPKFLNKNDKGDDSLDGENNLEVIPSTNQPQKEIINEKENQISTKFKAWKNYYQQYRFSLLVELLFIQKFYYYQK